MSGFVSVVISGNKICKFERKENEIFLLSAIEPGSVQYDEYLKKTYHFICVNKKKYKDIWIVTVQTCKEIYLVKWITFSTFLRQYRANESAKPIYDYVLEQQKTLSVKLQYGLKSGRIISIWDIRDKDRGLKCGCVCPGCGMPLQAKLGSGKIQRHFSHNNANCNIANAQQTALHLLAKEIIECEKIVKFPPIIVPFEQTNLYKIDPHYLWTDDCDSSTIPMKMEYKKATAVRFDSVTLEKRVSSIVPDVIAFKGEKKCIIEIAVTHFIDENKERKIRELKLPVLEVDVSSLTGKNLNREVLRDIIVNQIENKKWIYNPLLEKAIIWAESQYETKIGKTAEEIKKRVIQYERQELQKEKRIERRTAGREALKNAFIPENYVAITKALQNDKAYRALYQKLWLHKKSEVPPFYLNIPISGEFIFHCDRRIWQTLIFYKFVYNRKKNDAAPITISLEKVIKWVLKYQKEFSINWEYSYKTKIGGTTRHLPRDVVYGYLLYLEELGFIVFASDSTSGFVIKPHELIPPKTNYASKLQIAIDSVDSNEPDVDEQIYRCLVNLAAADDI